MILIIICVFFKIINRYLTERNINFRDGTVSSIGPFKVQRTIQPDTFNDGSPPHSFRSSWEPNEYVTLALAAEVERERLLELVIVLNRRLDKERSDTDILSVSFLLQIKTNCMILHRGVAELFARRKKQIGEIGIETSQIGDGKSGNREDRYGIQSEAVA